MFGTERAAQRSGKVHRDPSVRCADSCHSRSSNLSRRTEPPTFHPRCIRPAQPLARVLAPLRAAPTLLPLTCRPEEAFPGVCRSLRGESKQVLACGRTPRLRGRGGTRWRCWPGAPTSQPAASRRNGSSAAEPGSLLRGSARTGGTAKPRGTSSGVSVTLGTLAAATGKTVS